MAGRKTTKRAGKKRNGNRGETPITIGGGGRRGLLTITWNPAYWTNTPGKLTLADGTCKKIKISSGEVDVKLPFNTNVDIELLVKKPARRRR